VQPSADANLKAELRAMALARRDGLDRSFRERASQAIAEMALPLLVTARARTLSGYWPIRSEVDPREILETAARYGIEVALPVVIDRRELRFRAWRPGDTLVPGGFGTSEPSAEAPDLLPDIMLVPLAGFDRSGHRLGYGKGHYDRAIARMAAGGHRPVLIGLAFSVQEVPKVPAESHDARLDRIVTEAGVWNAEQAG
jgi:5-formyltetrahydrofolate cyclo-ligase